MKRIILLFLCSTMVLSFTIISNASKSPDNRIYAEKVNAAEGEEIDIPVKITGNSGFMGFGFFVDYDPEVLTPVSAAKFDTLPGMFDDSIATSSVGSFKVIYTGTENYTEDGELFELSFLVKESAADQTAIRLTYIQDDTFDESFHDVVMTTESITIRLMSEEPDVPDEPGEQKLSVRIKKWAAGLRSPFNRIMSILVKPITFVLSLFGR